MRLELSPQSIHTLFTVHRSSGTLSPEVIPRLFEYKLEDKEMLEVLVAIKDKAVFDASTMALAIEYNRSESIISWLRQYS
jgi:hypothetical protein